MTLAVWAGVSAAPVLDDEQRRRLVIELLAALGADLDPGLATLGAAAFGLGQLVEDRDTREILGQPLRPWPRRFFLVPGVASGSGSATGGASGEVGAVGVSKASGIRSG